MILTSVRGEILIANLPCRHAVSDNILSDSDDDIPQEMNEAGVRQLAESRHRSAVHEGAATPLAQRPTHAGAEDAEGREQSPPGTQMAGLSAQRHLLASVLQDREVRAMQRRYYDKIMPQTYYWQS